MIIFQPILAAYPTRHSWIISAHINLGTLHKPMHMFIRQKNTVCETISKLRNHPDDAIKPLQPLQVELDNLHNLFMAYKPVFSSARSILQMQPSFDRKPIPPSGRKKRSLLPFISSALKWLTGTATTKDIKHIKKRISSLIETQERQRKTMVDIASILNLTHYETQVNRQWINIIFKELTKSNKDIRALFNITNQLATQVQVQNIMLHLRAMLVNLRDCLHFIKQLANHVLEYIDTATTGILTRHLIPVPDLQKMLYQIESELPPNMHLPIPPSDPLHFYRYLPTHILVGENQFLLLIDVPIQDRAQQIQIYKIINLPVPVENYSMRYTMDNKYLGVTYDRTKVMDIPEDQFKLCKEANRQCCPLTTPLQPLTNPPSCVVALYTKNSQEIDRLCELTTKTQPELYLPIPLASNVWAIISSPFKQQLPVTVIYPTKPTMSIHISPPIHVLWLEPTCSATSQHFHLPPKYKDTHVMMNLSIYNANLDIINISSALFRITQHIPSVQQQKMLERLAALPLVPIKRITMEWLGCISFVVSIMSTVACITKKKVAAWKPPALTGFLSLCRKDKNKTKMDDEDMDGPIYQPSNVILTVIRPQESHGLCVIPQPAQKKDHRKQSDQPNGVSDFRGTKILSRSQSWRYRKGKRHIVRSRKWFHCRTRSKKIRIKDFNKENVNHQSTLIGNQS